MVGTIKSWEEEIYWNHFQFIHFTLFLHTTTNFQQQLALPKTFSDNLKKKLPKYVTLKGPSGVVWNIGLTTKDDTVYFTNGWQQFVNDHSLKESDFLFFKYNGESLFEVLIFDGRSFCEKAASYFVGKCGHAQIEQGGIEAKDTNKSVEEINTAFDAGVESASPKQFMADAVAKTTPVAAPSQSTGKRIKRPVNKFTLVLGLPKAANSHKRAHDLVACNKEHSEASIVHRSGKEDVKKIAQSFTSSFPYFVKIFKTGDINVSRTMKIPYQFSAAYLPDCKTAVTLRNSRGECWTVNSIPYAKGRTVQTNPYAKRRPVHTFCGGWVAFVRDNNIKFGDTCVFELVSDYVMQVHISGVGKEGLDHQNGNVKLDIVAS